MAFTSWHRSAPVRNPAAMEEGNGVEGEQGRKL